MLLLQTRALAGEHRPVDHEPRAHFSACVRWLAVEFGVDKGNQLVDRDHLSEVGASNAHGRVNTASDQ